MEKEFLKQLIEYPDYIREVLPTCIVQDGIRYFLSIIVQPLENRTTIQYIDDLSTNKVVVMELENHDEYMQDTSYIKNLVDDAIKNLNNVEVLN